MSISSRLCRCAAALEHSFQLTAAMQVHQDVAATNELTVHVHLASKRSMLRWL